jgi:outer membrane receptor protein involved in Fe transport
MGEVDPIRSLTTLPGVSTSGELAAGFNVRGGESGQNLVLQDGAIIYNPSHLFGFFSAFNPDMVSGVTLYKGGGPAYFGGRISSVLDVSLKNGDAGKHSVTGGIGFVSSRLAAEGPIVRNKSSYLVGGRISYCNWLINATDDIQLKNSSANFYDITAKVFQTINENNYLTISLYNSYDAFSLAADSVFSWGTQNYALKWDHTFKENFFSTLNISNSNYFSEVESNNELDGFVYRNAINNLALKYDLTYSLSEESKLIAGLESTGTLLEPGKRDPDENAVNIKPENMNDQRSIESAVYVQGDFKLSKKLSMTAGLRYSYFVRLGREDIYTYDYNNIQGRYPGILDTIQYSNGDVIKHYSGLEPRLSLRFLMSENASLKASYFRGYQYMHLISNTTSVTPQDYWVSSGPYLKPEIGDQYSLGYFRNLKQNRYEVSVEGFYKNVTNAVDYIEGADITLNPVLDAGLSQGKGRAYGVEVLLKRNTGRLNGWLAYTYSRSLRKFDTESSIVINDGKYYPSAFDQPNNVSLVLNYQLDARTTFSANFNYSTGRPITIPISKFSYDAYLSVLNYSERNEYRIPDYHRLDVSLTIKENPNKKHRIHSEWVISIFNVYGRKNTYSIFFDRYGRAKKLSVLGSIFPSISYNFRF